MSRIYDACKIKDVKQNIHLHVQEHHEGSQGSQFSSEFMLDFFQVFKQSQIYLNLYNVDLIEIEECGMILLEN